MGQAKRKQERRRAARKDDSWQADRWLVQGTAGNGDEVNFMEDTREAADHAAQKLIGRGGKVTVTRCVYNGPAATWLPEGYRRR